MWCVEGTCCIYTYSFVSAAVIAVVLLLLLLLLFLLSSSTVMCIIPGLGSAYAETLDNELLRDGELLRDITMDISTDGSSKVTVTKRSKL